MAESFVLACPLPPRPGGGVCLTHQFHNLRVNVGGALQPEMDAVAEPPKVFDPVNARMLDPAAQPEAGVEPPAANDGSRESDSGLENNSGLLRVDSNRTAGPCDCHPAPKCRPQGRWFAGKVLCQREAPA